MPKPEGAPVPVPSGGPERVEYAVLCGPEDRAAVWAARALRARGLDVRVVTTHEIVYSTSLRHTVTADGVSTSVRLADGAVLGPDLRGTLNRITWIPTGHLAAATAADRDYALQELQAVLTSLVHGLPGVVLGRPDGRGLCGAVWRIPESMVRAGRAGLEVWGYRTGAPPPPEAGRIPVVVVGDEVVAPAGHALPAAIVTGCRDVAREHGGGLLGLEFVIHTGWRLVGMTPVPDLSSVGEPLADALHAALLDRVGVSA